MSARSLGEFNLLLEGAERDAMCYLIRKHLPEHLHLRQDPEDPCLVATDLEWAIKILDACPEYLVPYMERVLAEAIIRATAHIDQKIFKKYFNEPLTEFTVQRMNQTLREWEHKEVREGRFGLRDLILHYSGVVPANK
jgi:hypothetical protein